MTDEEREAIAHIERAQTDYKLCFGSPAGQRVLIALADFCRAAETCVVAPPDRAIDINRTLVLEGRREVFLTIQRNLNLTPEHLFRLFAGQPYDPGAPHD